MNFFKKLIFLLLFLLVVGFGFVLNSKNANAEELNDLPSYNGQINNTTLYFNFNVDNFGNFYNDIYLSYGLYERYFTPLTAYYSYDDIRIQIFEFSYVSNSYFRIYINSDLIYNYLFDNQFRFSNYELNRIVLTEPEYNNYSDYEFYSLCYLLYQRGYLTTKNTNLYYIGGWYRFTSSIFNIPDYDSQRPITFVYDLEFYTSYIVSLDDINNVNSSRNYFNSLYVDEYFLEYVYEENDAAVDSYEVVYEGSWDFFRNEEVYLQNQIIFIKYQYVTPEVYDFLMLNGYFGTTLEVEQLPEDSVIPFVRLILSVADVPINIIQSMLNFSLFGINIFIVLTSVFTIFVFVWVLKRFL